MTANITLMMKQRDCHRKHFLHYAITSQRNSSTSVKFLRSMAASNEFAALGVGPSAPRSDPCRREGREMHAITWGTNIFHFFHFLKFPVISLSSWFFLFIVVLVFLVGYLL